MLRRVAGGTAIITAATIIRSTTITPGTTITTVAAIGIDNLGYSAGRTGLTWAIVHGGRRRLVRHGTADLGLILTKYSERPDAAFGDIPGRF